MMKFSYRVIAVILLLVTVVIIYLLLGDEVFNVNSRVRHHDIISSKIHTSGGLGNQVKVNRGHGVGGSDLEECRLAERALPTDGLTTYELFNKMKPSYQGNTLLSMNTKRDDKNVIYKDKLTVLLMPHSHNDPGWLMPISEYYNLQTRSIFENMLKKLEKYPNMTFIWAETVFLSMWWPELSASKKQRVKNLISRKQLEIVNGGWVAPDEASTHYFAMIDQLIEGHQWLEKNIGVKPKASWSPDPFGYSSTMPYILNRAGMKDMVILRIHDDVKAELRKNRNLEFHWRQQWDTSPGETSTFCHMLPYVLYSIKHSCGPNPYICLMFDFRKIPGEYSEANAPTLTKDNLEKYSKYLVDEFRAKSDHFRHNVILYPLGDDFRFDRDVEWDQQYTNYNKLFNYINSRKDWNVEAKFGTLSDYFSAIKKEEEIGNVKGGKFPTLYGGFFPYMDRDEEYWTGYYTTRPFFKQLEREIEGDLRSAEILNSLAVAYQSHYGTKFRQLQGNLKRLTVARRNLALFQHHDAITGTSKPSTVADYETKLWEAKAFCKKVKVTSAQYLLVKDSITPTPGKIQKKYMINVDDARNADEVQPQKKIVMVTREGVKVMIFNPIAKTRFELIRLRVSSPHVIVKDAKGQIISSQINPVWVNGNQISHTDYELVFYSHLPPLGITSFTILDVPQHSKPVVAGVSHIATLHTPTLKHFETGKNSKPVFTVKSLDKSQGAKIILNNPYITAKFNNNGLLKTITTKQDGRTTSVSLSFMVYGSRGSGAYLFQPQSQATSGFFSREPEVLVLRGPLVSEVRVKYYVLQHTVRIFKTDEPIGAALEIENYLDMSPDQDLMDKEIIMKFMTSIGSGHIWYTDLNGFQMARHKTHKKFYIAGNYQPMTSMAYLEGNNSRFSVLSAQSHGVTSLKSGYIEIMLDRKLSSDDIRGLGEGVYDNRRTLSRFLILVERSATPLPRSAEEQRPSYPSLLSQSLSDQLCHPVTNFIIYRSVASFQSSFMPLSSSFPCDVNVVNMKTIESSSSNMSNVDIILILHRAGFQCQFRTYELQCNLTNGVVKDPFLDLKVKDKREMTLSLMYEKQSAEEEMKLGQMEIKTYKIVLKSKT